MPTASPWFGFGIKRFIWIKLFDNNCQNNDDLISNLIFLFKFMIHFYSYIYFYGVLIFFKHSPYIF